MFRKRVKKQFPPGTFLPTSARVVAIIHLCMAFTLVLWFASQPFMGRYFAIKSRMAVFERIFDDPQYSQVDEKQQIILANKYATLAEELNTSFGTKCVQSWHVLFAEVPVYERGWLLLSLILPIFLLKRREGSWQAAWLLPLLCLAFCIDNRLNGIHGIISEEEKLFPSETYIIENYLSKPLSDNILEQQDQLREGWNNYLKKNWGNEFLFTLARAEKIELPDQMIVNKRLSFFMLGLYLFWNVYFAWTFFLHRREISDSKPEANTPLSLQNTQS